MFGFIKKLFSIFFILLLYFMIITFFSIAQENKNSIDVSFDHLLPEFHIEKLNKILSYLIQFIKNFQANNQCTEDFEKFSNAMLNSAIDLNSLLFDMNLNTDLYKNELYILSKFLNEICTVYEVITNNYNS